MNPFLNFIFIYPLISLIIGNFELTTTINLNSTESQNLTTPNSSLVSTPEFLNEIKLLEEAETERNFITQREANMTENTREKTQTESTKTDESSTIKTKPTTETKTTNEAKIKTKASTSTELKHTTESPKTEASTTIESKSKSKTETKSNFTTTVKPESNSKTTFKHETETEAKSKKLTKSKTTTKPEAEAVTNSTEISETKMEVRSTTKEKLKTEPTKKETKSLAQMKTTAKFEAKTEATSKNKTESKTTIEGNSETTKPKSTVKPLTEAKLKTETLKTTAKSLTETEAKTKANTKVNTKTTPKPKSEAMSTKAEEKIKTTKSEAKLKTETKPEAKQEAKPIQHKHRQHHKHSTTTPQTILYEESDNINNGEFKVIVNNLPENKEKETIKGAIQELKLHDDPAEAANQCNENWDAEKSDLISSGFGSPEENELRVDEEEEKFPTPPGSGPAHFLPKNINLLTTTQKEESKTTTLSPTLNTPLIQPQILQQMIPGPKGERGEPGMPGICAATECRMPPPGPPGLQGPPGVFPGLTENDLRRIAAWPGVKGEKGDRGECCDKQQIKQSNTYREGYEDEGEVVLLNGQHKSEQLPAYNKKVHGNDLKGEKGDRGEPGPPGLPGKLIEKSSSSFSGVKIFQTALELLAATHNCAIGSLAFALSTQQLFIRVNAGWKQIILGGTLLTAQSGTKEITAKTSTKQNNAADSDELNRLSYWLALDEPSSEEFRTFTNNDKEMINTLPSPEQRWQPRWPPKETRRFEEDEEEEKQKNRVPTVQQKRHKDRIIHLIALNEPLNGNFGGVRGADLECYRQARQSGFSTTFRAFLSSRVQDLNKLVHLDDRHYTPVVNIRGERLFDSWNSVFDGERSVHAHVPIYSFNRKDVTSDSTWPNRWLWHGSTSEGLRTSTAFCDGWRSDNFNSFGNASPLHSRHSLTGQSKEANCNNRFVVLCVEVMSKFNVDSKLGKRFMSDDVIRK
uniref:Endostatin domain-containing protein n=1 Tax=Meloidogyne hapla TaxID=6305 RepID=A0A1I8BVJ8_MELHA